MAELLSWPMAAHKFRKTKKTRQDVAPPMTVRDLLAEVELRRHRWDELMVSIGGERGVPMLSTRPDGAADVALSSADWALLCKVDGVRDIAELATECGFTVFEAGHVIQSLMNAGLVDVELPDDEPVASVTSLDSARGKKPAFEPAPDPANDDLAASVKKVTAALADLFKPVTPPTAPKHEAPAAPSKPRPRQRRQPSTARRRTSTQALEASSAPPAVDPAIAEQERLWMPKLKSDSRIEAAETTRVRGRSVARTRDLVGRAASDCRDRGARPARRVARAAARRRLRLRPGSLTTNGSRTIDVASRPRHGPSTRRGPSRVERSRPSCSRPSARRWKARPGRITRPGWRSSVAAPRLEAWLAHLIWLEGDRADAEAQAWADHEVWLDRNRRARNVSVSRRTSRTAKPTAWEDHSVWLDEQRASTSKRKPGTTTPNG